MILVTLGTQDKPFVRLLEMVQQLIDEKIIDQKVNVQAGYTSFSSKDMNIFDYIDMDKFYKSIVYRDDDIENDMDKDPHAILIKK